MNHGKTSMAARIVPGVVSTLAGVGLNALGLGGAIPAMHKGGPVKKSGLHNLKKGEHVLTAAQKQKLMKSGTKSLMRKGK